MKKNSKYKQESSQYEKLNAALACFQTYPNKQPEKYYIHVPEGWEPGMNCFASEDEEE